MNTENDVNTRAKGGKLEALSAELQSWVVELARNARLVDVVMALKEHGIETSATALGRFVRKARERELLEDAEASKGTVTALAECSRDGVWREGTLGVVRQRMYERALASEDPEEARELHAALVKEEVKLKELELETRKVAAFEQQVKLQEWRARAELAARVGEKKLKEATVVESHAVEEGVVERLEGEKRGLVALLAEVCEVLNRGGDPMEKVLEARSKIENANRRLQIEN